jgi:hypothetical protein
MNTVEKQPKGATIKSVKPRLYKEAHLRRQLGQQPT